MNNIKYIITKTNGDVVNTNVKEYHHQIVEYIGSIDTTRSKTFKLEKLNFGGISAARWHIVEEKDLFYIFFSESKNHLKSSSVFRREVDYFFASLENFDKELKKIEEKHNGALRILTHNLTKYVAQSLQQIELLIPQHVMTKKNWNRKKNYINSIIQEDSYEAAMTILNLAKFAQGMKTEISIYGKLYSHNPSLKIEKHNIHRVIMNSLYFFFPEFTDKNIEVTQEQTSLEGKFDYETFSVALYHIIDNACKYCKKNSNITITTKEIDGYIQIAFSMLSIQVIPNEKENLFLEGVRGTHANQLQIQGSGIGMFVIKEVILLNKGKISFRTTKDSMLIEDLIPYENNIIEISLPI